MGKIGTGNLNDAHVVIGLENTEDSERILVQVYISDESRKGRFLHLNQLLVINHYLMHIYLIGCNSYISSHWL